MLVVDEESLKTVSGIWTVSLLRFWFVACLIRCYIQLIGRPLNRRLRGKVLRLMKSRLCALSSLHYSHYRYIDLSRFSFSLLTWHLLNYLWSANLASRCSAVRFLVFMLSLYCFRFYCEVYHIDLSCLSAASRCVSRTSYLCAVANFSAVCEYDL